MLILTTPQREMLLWAYKRRNSFKFADVVASIHGGQPKRTDMIRKTLKTLDNAEIFETLLDAVGQDVFSLTTKGRELAGNIVAAIKAKTKVAA